MNSRVLSSTNDLLSLKYKCVFGFKVLKYKCVMFLGREFKPQVQPLILNKLKILNLGNQFEHLQYFLKKNLQNWQLKW
jgi:hypothetical protein